MLDSVEIIFRTLTAFILLWIFVQLLGKQTIAQRTYHLYIASIMMGAVVFLLNLVSLRNQRFRKWIAGEPAMLIQKGQILEESMKQMGYSIDTLKQALRGKDIFNIDEVECAILEVNGLLSVLKKPQYQNTIKQDLRIVPTAVTVPVELVYEGNILYDNLSNDSFGEDWLMKELMKRNLAVKDISYAVVGENGNLYIDLFLDQLD
jgi:uncharacterized membrane protein YcaP (DUF421 family)